MIEYAAVYEPTYTDTETALTSTAQQAFNPCIPTTLPVPVNELGNHVANCHSNGFDTQYQVIDKFMTMITWCLLLQNLYTGGDKPCTVGYSDKNKALNRFKNITVCMFTMITIIIAFCAFSINRWWQ